MSRRTITFNVLAAAIIAFGVSFMVFGWFKKSKPHPSPQSRPASERSGTQMPKQSDEQQIVISGEFSVRQYTATGGQPALLPIAIHVNVAITNQHTKPQTFEVVTGVFAPANGKPLSVAGGAKNGGKLSFAAGEPHHMSFNTNGYTLNLLRDGDGALKFYLAFQENEADEAVATFEAQLPKLDLGDIRRISLNSPIPLSFVRIR